MYPETLLVFIKYRKNITSEAEKEGTFTEVTIDAILVGEYIQVQKVINSVLSKLMLCVCREIM